MLYSKRQTTGRNLRRRRGTTTRKKASLFKKVCSEVFFLEFFLFAFTVVFVVGLVLYVKDMFPAVGGGDGSGSGSHYKHKQGRASSGAHHGQQHFSKVGEFPYFGTSILDVEAFEPQGGGRFTEWKDGDTPYHVDDAAVREKSDELARQRREHVRSAMQHAWNGYREYAFGKDEVQPLSGESNTRWEGLGTTLVDSLDTLWLMGMTEEFDEARDWLKDSLNDGLHDIDSYVSVFETTIRSLGGYLAAYDWSGDDVFLSAAKDLADRLLPAFDSPSGLPWNLLNLSSGHGKNEKDSKHENNIASIGTLQIEFRYLAEVTGDHKYADKPMKAFNMLESLKNKDSLYGSAVVVDKKKPEPGRVWSWLTFGGRADSFYEYMLKLWLQGGKQDAKYRKMYDDSIDGMHKVLLQYSIPHGLAYIGQEAVMPPLPLRRKKGKKAKLPRKAPPKVDNMEHLDCFMGGLLALGAYTSSDDLNSKRSRRDLKTAKALGYTCYQMYASSRTGLSAEVVHGFRKKHLLRPKNGLRKDRGIPTKKDFLAPQTIEKTEHDADFYVKRKSEFYLLRPETVETFYILNKLTGDPIYREWGWEIFQAIEKYCKTDIAYGQYPDVTNVEVGPKDSMESFFLGETLKYLYLLFDPDSPVDFMKKHVFNTEAHPLRMLEYV